MKGRCKFRVRFHPSTEEPAVTCRKARRHDLNELPSSDKDRWTFPGEIRRQMSTPSAAEALIRASDLQDD
eukprot:2447962-Pyramimonas_sp.AAC.1